MSLGKVYYDSKHAAGIGSVAKLVKGGKSNERAVEEWLSGQDTYTLHKPVRKRFPRNLYTVTNIDDVWEMDLADLSSLSKHNDKYKYLLNIIDIFARYACSVPLKDKTANSITAALKTLFHNRKPISIQSDNGTEFVNETDQQYLKRQGVGFHSTHNPNIRGDIVEWFQRSLKSRMYKFFTKNNTYSYLDVINKVVISYNCSVHSTIGMLPTKVTPSSI